MRASQFERTPRTLTKTKDGSSSQTRSLGTSVTILEALSSCSGVHMPRRRRLLWIRYLLISLLACVQFLCITMYTGWPRSCHTPNELTVLLRYTVKLETGVWQHCQSDLNVTCGNSVGCMCLRERVVLWLDEASSYSFEQLTVSLVFPVQFVYVFGILWVMLHWQYDCFCM
jgi:hypothetical protein